MREAWQMGASGQQKKCLHDREVHGPAGLIANGQTAIAALIGSQSHEPPQHQGASLLSEAEA